MAIVGIPSTSSYLSITRDKLIEMAHKVIGVLEPGQVLDGDQLQDGIDFLTMIVRQTDQSGRWRWTIEEAQHIPITANTYSYTPDTGLPTTIAELLTAVYRDANGMDMPLRILKAEAYEAIANKVQSGDPVAVYLTETTDLSLRTLYTYPSPSSASTQSKIAGPYRCLRTHVSSAATEPVTGANWRVYWEPGGDGFTAWASGMSYTAPPQLRLLFRRPIVDFATASQPPDFPLQWPRLLLYQLAHDLGDLYGIPLEERNLLIAKAKGASSDIFPSMKAKTNNIHNKAKFF